MKANGGSVMPRRCAIYTRKSSEEGLDQSFNSLDAQREACEAYAVSQRHEGWQVLNTRYDDGGYSGGNLARPALQRLLADIKTGIVDLVVVYKIDRLTRSLMDFSKLVEVFDQHHTSFVSITQHFNTTSSMGRLTLNMLLSFAQFEREVTSERIRDKVAASKRKGMWMGGTVPLGYAVVDKALVVNEEEAVLVRRIFERYRDLGCVRALKHELDQAGIQSRSRAHSDGTTGAKQFARGGLYCLLKNRVYIGEVAHKGESFAGQHDAIVPSDLWHQVQAQIESHRQGRVLGTYTPNRSLLAGMVIDAAGHRLTPCATNKGGKRYRYYLIRPGDQDDPHNPRKRVSFPAHDVERIATEQWVRMLTAQDLDVQLAVTDTAESAALRAKGNRLAKRWTTMDTPERREVWMNAGFQVRIDSSRVEASADPGSLAALLLSVDRKAIMSAQAGSVPRLVKSVDASLIKAPGETRILEDDKKTTTASLTAGHQSLLKSIAQGRVWMKALIAGEIASVDEIKSWTGLSRTHIARAIKCALISPELVSKLTEGSAPLDLTWKKVRPLAIGKWYVAMQKWCG
jgi:DNA invertase Pin-like site-specific DNA recombinase